MGIAVYKHFDGYPSAILPALFASLFVHQQISWNAGQHAALFIQKTSTLDVEILVESERYSWVDVAWHYRVNYQLQRIEVEGQGRTFNVSFGTDPTLLGLAAVHAEQGG